MGADLSVASCDFTPEVEGIPRAVLGGLVVFWTTLFSLNFNLSWNLLDKYWPRFREYDDSKKADNASRVNSTLHALIVPPILLYGLHSVKFGRLSEPLESTQLLQFGFTVSVSYFISDLFVVWRYHTPMWQIFLLHHVMAVTPYLLYLAVVPCRIGARILAHYMLVELTNVTYNAKLWMEELGHTRSKWYAFLLYTTAAEWFVFRNINPAWAVWTTHRRIFPFAPNARRCLGPGVVCGWFVNLFCGVAFYVVFVKEIRARWQGKDAKDEEKQTSKKAMNGNVTQAKIIDNQARHRPEAKGRAKAVKEE